MLKFKFAIETKDGVKVDNLIVIAVNYSRAKVRLEQLYLRPKIISHELITPEVVTQSFEKILDLVCKSS